mgnify:CR=1 FL=1
MRSGILHVFDTVSAENERPVRFCIGVVLVQDLLINRHCFVEIVIPAEMVGPVVKVCFPIIVQPREGLFRTAGITNANGCALLEFYCAAAHFTFEY